MGVYGCFRARRPASVIDPQYIFGRCENRHRANLSDLDAAWRSTVLPGECKQPDLARDRCGQSCRTGGRSVLRLVEGQKILDPPIKWARRQSIQLLLRYRADNELSRLGRYR